MTLLLSTTTTTTTNIVFVTYDAHI